MLYGGTLYWSVDRYVLCEVTKSISGVITAAMDDVVRHVTLLYSGNVSGCSPTPSHYRADCHMSAAKYGVENARRHAHSNASECDRCSRPMHDHMAIGRCVLHGLFNVRAQRVLADLRMPKHSLINTHTVTS